MKRFKSSIVAVCAVLVAAAYIVPSLPAAAATSSASLSIAPKKNYVIEPGKSVKDTLVIRNLDRTSSLDLTLRVVDFTYSDDSGTPKLMLDPEAPQTTWSLKPFMKVPDTVSIPPSGSKTLDMSVSVPKGHGAGSYYSAIIYSSGSGEGGNVGLSASGVTLVFASIPGKVKQDLKIEKFGPYDQGSGYMWWATEEPLRMGYTLKNSGNVTEAPVGSITLRHLFGKEYTIGNINPSQSLALIGQSRTFAPCIKLDEKNVEFQGSQAATANCVSGGLWPGYYSTSIDVFYGQNGNYTQEISKTGWFWYMPWWFIILLIVVIAALVYYGRKFVNFIRLKLYGPNFRKKKSPPSRRR